MNNNDHTKYGLFLIRASLGIVMIMHSLYLKLFVFTLAGTAGYFTSIGLPSWLAYAVFAIEAVGGIALVVGFQSRAFAAVLVPVLVGATWAHWPNGWLFTAENGGWEYPLFLTLAAVTVALSNDETFSIQSRVKAAV
jgi:putative oxidoreductase